MSYYGTVTTVTQQPAPGGGYYPPQVQQQQLYGQPPQQQQPQQPQQPYYPQPAPAAPTPPYYTPIAPPQQQQQQPQQQYVQQQPQRSEGAAQQKKDYAYKEGDALRKEYDRKWAAGFWEAPCKDCGTFCAAIFCPPCTAFAMRRRLYQGDLTRYECCAGQYKLPCECCYCRESACPGCLLCLETILFHPCSIMGTRFALQHDMQLENTCCDKCMIGVLVIFKGSAACFTMVGLVAQAACCHAIGDSMFCTVCGCIQTQNKLQLDARDSGAVTTQPGMTSKLVH